MSTTATTGILSGGFNMINKATGGFTYTLPPATGSLNIIRVVVQTAITSGNGIIKTATVADFMTGMMMFATTTFGAGSIEAVGGTDALITLVAASGGQKRHVHRLHRYRAQPVAGRRHHGLDHGRNRGWRLGLTESTRAGHPCPVPQISRRKLTWPRKPRR